MNTLTFDEFASEVKKSLEKNILPPFKISDVMDMKTTRGAYKGISILKDNIGPAFNLSEMYEYMSDKQIEEIDFDNIAKEMIAMTLNNLSNVKSSKAYLEDIKSDIRDRKNLLLVPLNSIDVENYGNEIPTKQVADINFACALNSNDRMILLTNKLLQSMNIPFDKVYDMAKNNVEPQIFMSFDKNANSVLTMIAITNSEQNFGANVLSRVDLLEEIIKEYNIENPAIIPSSKQDVILIDLNSNFGFGLTLDDITEMIQSVNLNKDAVKPSEVLSNNLYLVRDGQLEIATDKNLELDNNKDEIELDM
ncbi:MAG: DUF5688 family protein [Clostridia bacterium]|jgi:hypothetical protein